MTLHALCANCCGKDWTVLLTSYSWGVLLPPGKTVACCEKGQIVFPLPSPTSPVHSFSFLDSCRHVLTAQVRLSSCSGEATFILILHGLLFKTERQINISFCTRAAKYVLKLFDWQWQWEQGCPFW